MARDTSIEAFNKIKENGLLGKRQFEVYNWFFENGPATARDCYESLCRGKVILNPGSYITRISELKKMGSMIEVGERVDSDTKHRVYLWDVTSKIPVKFEKPKRQKCPTCDGHGYIQTSQGKLF